jgi:hypothetical protein
MTPSEIITQEAQNIGVDADVILRKINKLVQSKAGVLLQKNNSLLLLITIAKHVVELHVFTADRPAVLADSVKYFISKIRESDIKKVYGDSNPKQEGELQKTLKLLKKLGVNVEKSNVPQYSWMAKV